MKLLRDSLLLRALRRLLAGRRDVVRRPYAVTVPAPLEHTPLGQTPLEQATGNNVVELHRRNSSHASAPAQDNALPSSVHRAVVSSR
ncbi:hypothetical protein [Rhodanobacter sp. OK091]|jgi:hypothetical protein|uniref:hypothetical protein n=1 Tax=Rhodanobacter sp. OK091 TaxID=1881037 RepID=UPI000910967C|nr:hypothetical protein [Rhodanobacter sp. OK091]SHM40047.1 hypothetical protein SAMN05428972_3444 [Rhodanobacter sp. OK091]